MRSLVNLVTVLRQAQHPLCDIKVVCSGRELDGTRLEVEENSLYEHEIGGFGVCYEPSLLTLWQTMREDQVAYINGLYSIKFNLLPLLFSRGKLILAPRGMLSPAALEKKKWKKSGFLFLLKLILRNRQVQFHATSEQEKIDIVAKFGNNYKIELISNITGVAPLNVSRNKQAGHLTLATVALISPMKNHLLVLKALKNIEYPIQYDIWGPIMDDNYWALCEQEIKDLPANVNVNYCGPCLPAETTGKMEMADVIIQPSESENFGHSLVEAMIIGRPIITSYNTPWQELAENNAGINVKNTVQDIEKAITCFAIMDEGVYINWSRQATSYINNRLETDKTIQQYLNLFTAN